MIQTKLQVLELFDYICLQGCVLEYTVSIIIIFKGPIFNTALPLNGPTLPI